MPALAEISVTMTKRRVTLTLMHGDEIVEHEEFKISPPAEAAGAREVTRAAFDNLFDLLNFATNGR